MPSISGIDLAIRMKALYPASEIPLFSGQASNLDLLDSARAQSHDFDLLLKPIPPSELLAEIRKRIRSVSDGRPGSTS
jgi:CheY-like chemotaxis protein